MAAIMSRGDEISWNEMYAKLISSLCNSCRAGFSCGNIKPNFHFKFHFLSFLATETLWVMQK